MARSPRISPFIGIVVYNSSGLNEYPPIDTDVEIEYDLPDTFTQAWFFEFEKQQYPEAVSVYAEISNSQSNDYIKRLGIIGHARCLLKQGKLLEALEICVKAHRNVSSGKENAKLFKPVEETKTASIPLIIQARILDISIQRQIYETIDPFPSHIDYYSYGSAIGTLWIRASDDYSPLSRAMDAQTRIYLLHEFIKLADTDFLKDIMNQYPDLPSSQHRREGMKDNILKAKKRLIAEELALEVATKYPTNSFMDNWQEDTLRKLYVRSDAFGLTHKYLGKTYLTLVRPETIQIDLDAVEDIFRDSLFDYSITDSNYKHIAGITNQPNKMIMETGLGGYYLGWKLRLYYKNDAIFENTVKRTRLIYGWTATLVIGLMIIVCGFTVKSVLRQAEVNRLKNDFIATVTHELKTPLASMRVLVDTLLEGNYNDQVQATEYLQLISKENKRLTGLIDNFLTFSRMERNKQAFEMVAIAPAEIANDAAEAVRTKFSTGNCKFNISIDENLPNVYADKDAMVTVLVNLLDNAYKYSGDEKVITLEVFAVGNDVYYKVTDNGIGIPSRISRRIFEKFYQVDNSLSRTAEGCGLGLSIVKFILDAHDATVDVQSAAGEGTIFTVTMPAI